MRKKLFMKVAVGVCTFGLGAILAQAAAPPTPQGVITAKVFRNIGGTAVNDLTSNPKFPDSPDILAYPPYFELWATGDITTPAPNDGDDYGAQMIGYFYPDTTGDYTFYICSDDNSQLFLSTDDNPANKKLIAQETGWSGQRNYTGQGGGGVVEYKSSLTFTNSQWPVRDTVNGGATITLTQGRAYYIEALMKEGSGGDNLSVSIDGISPIPGTMLSTFDKTTGPASVKVQPQNVTAVEGQSATFNVVPDGTPPYTYQWQKGGVDITDATNATLVLAKVLMADNNAKFAVKVGNSLGSATSQQATLTVTADTTPPTVAKVSADTTFISIVIKYSEPVSDTALQKSNYSIDQGATISTITRVDAQTVKLTTSTLTGGLLYTITINGVQDMAATPNTIAANTKAQVQPFVFMRGVAVHQKYNNVSDGVGSSPDNLFNDPRYPGAPDRVDLVTMFEYPANAAGRNATADPARNYFDCIQGIFIPPATGDYVFFTAGADRWWLYLSTDESPANLHMIAAEPGGWSNPRGWVQMYSGSLESRRSDLSALNQWPTAPVITLEKDKKYYIMEVHHDPSWCGADDFSATYIRSGDADPANGTAPTLAGSVIGAYLDPTGASVSFTLQPQGVTVQEQRAATLTAAATGTSQYGGNVTYQWQSAPKGSSTFTDIAGATSASYTTPLLALSDDGIQYRVVATVPGAVANSAVATVTIVPDTFPPIALSAGALKNPANTYDVGIQFDEYVDEASATNSANYTISGVAVSGVYYIPKTPGVILRVGALTPGAPYTVTIKNVKDLKGNAITAQDLQFTVSSVAWNVVGADELGLGFPAGNAVVASGPGSFDVYSDGIAEWATYDETTFVYEQINGDFDKKVRIEYQDGSSQWARAGLIMRDAAQANFGVDRATQEGGAAGRYQKIHVNPSGPTLTGPGTLGNNSHEGNRRLDKGGATSSASLSRNASPAYPNAWVRLQRIGQTNNLFRSDDGIAWVYMGRTTWGVDNTDGTMPDAAYVGPEFAPENGNVTVETDRGRWLAKFRNYGDTFAAPGAQPQRTYGIGLNFGADRASGGIASALAATDVAGVPGVAQKNWNNLNGASGTKASLTADQNGTAQTTTMTVTWAANGVWTAQGDGEFNDVLQGADHTLMHAYLDTGASTTTTVKIESVPAPLTASGYDVYVYFAGGVAGKGGGYRIVDPASGAVIRDYVYARSQAFPTSYQQVQDNTSIANWGAGNYIVFKGLTAASIQIEATTAGQIGTAGLVRGVTNPRAPLSAVQLVAPGSAPPVTRPTISLNKVGNATTITFTGKLQSSTSVNGTYTEVPGATSPYTVDTSAGAGKFFRAAP